MGVGYDDQVSWNSEGAARRRMTVPNLKDLAETITFFPNLDLMEYDVNVTWFPNKCFYIWTSRFSFAWMLG